MAQKIKLFIPLIILIFLVVILSRELAHKKPRELPSALIGNVLPPFRTPYLFDPKKIFSHEDLQGHVSLLNFWASWCYACSVEVPMLLTIKEKYHIPIYSIDYKDNPEEAKKWLQQYGNPYKIIGMDREGDVAIDFGIYGTPETYIINPEGKIVYRHVGVINQEVWDNDFYPIIKKYEKH